MRARESEFQRSRPIAGILAIALLAASPVSADPCGMVPPIDIVGVTPVERIGLQKTYVFFKDGVETFVIRPGYRGHVDNFGMLIPFPTPPAIRKVSDDIFAHVAAAVDPPEVVVDLRPVRELCFPAATYRWCRDESPLVLHSVTVLSQEAVGMYEVAVLEAGSAAALARWMDANGYVYPKGMDAVCEDYIAKKWCFVAVKTRVGNKAAIDPRPGLRDVDPSLPFGVGFDGNVQAMGFRFRSDRLVVPMRLSAFNAGELRNVVYVLTDDPCKIDRMPEGFVVRQIPGESLFANLTAPLPLRVLGGKFEDIPDARRVSLVAERDPAPHNGLARDLFASDLLAARTGNLAHPFEEHEKELLRIGERLGLRGPEIDGLHADALEEQRMATIRDALAQIKSMTLTVIDGDFPREVIARDNLTFSPFTMDAAKNTPGSYDATLFGPAPEREGTRYTRTASLPMVWLLLIAGAALGVALGHRRRRSIASSRRVRPATARSRLPALLLVLAILGAPATARAQGSVDPIVDRLIERLDDPARSATAANALVALGEEAVDALIGEAIEGPRLTRRGWAIVCLGEIGGDRVDAFLQALHDGPRQPALVRTWAAAARVRMTRTMAGLIEIARQLVPSMPALVRPVGQHLAALDPRSAGDVPVEDLIVLAGLHDDLLQAIQPAILAADPERLVRAMTTASNQEVRRKAAAYLATIGLTKYEEVTAAVVRAYDLDVEVTHVPWHGGPLFVPSLAWQADEARHVARSLIEWLVFCERKGLSQEKTQIHNNLRSLEFARVAGYKSPGWREVGVVEWLAIWKQAHGAGDLREILERQDVDADPRFAPLLVATTQ